MLEEGRKGVTEMDAGGVNRGRKGETENGVMTHAYTQAGTQIKTEQDVDTDQANALTASLYSFCFSTRRPYMLNAVALVLTRSVHRRTISNTPDQYHVYTGCGG